MRGRGSDSNAVGRVRTWRINRVYGHRLFLQSRGRDDRRLVIVQHPVLILCNMDRQSGNHFAESSRRCLGYVIVDILWSTFLVVRPFFGLTDKYITPAIHTPNFLTDFMSGERMLV